MILVGLSTRKASVPGGTKTRIPGTQDLNPPAKSIRNSFYSFFPPTFSTLSLKLLIVITILSCVFVFLKVKKTYSHVFTFSSVESNL